MKSITCIITDDEPFARKGLINYIDQAGFFELKGECEDALELRTKLRIETVDLLFLDIQMPRLTGIDFLRSLQYSPNVIFTTAYPDYALQGFELDVLDYLLKPISFDRFMKAAFKAKDFFSSKTTGNNHYVFVKSEGKLEKIDFPTILFIEGMENYIIVHTTEKRIITHSTLRNFFERLPPDNFIQVHKSFIVAKDKISAIEGNLLHVRHHKVPVSRQLKETVLAKLGYAR